MESSALCSNASMKCSKRSHSAESVTDVHKKIMPLKEGSAKFRSGMVLEVYR